MNMQRLKISARRRNIIALIVGACWLAPGHAGAADDFPVKVQASAENAQMVVFSWPGAGQGQSFMFGVGTIPGCDDIQPWQKLCRPPAYFYPCSRGCKPGDVIYATVKIIENADEAVIVSGPVRLDNSSLGDKSNRIEVVPVTEPDFLGNPGWSAEQAAGLKRFLRRMLPIVREVYGPPSRDCRIKLIKSPDTVTPIYLAHSNEIYVLADWKPQLLTHEVLHSFRDNVLISSDSAWRYDPELSAFEEGFAEAVSYECMNRYEQYYPGDLAADSRRWWISPLAREYQYLNVAGLESGRLYPERGARWMAGARYQMANEAISRIAREYPDFYKQFNREWYARLKADPQLRSSRALVVDIIAKIAPRIEGLDAREWIARQHIFRCRVGIRI